MHAASILPALFFAAAASAQLLAAPGVQREAVDAKCTKALNEVMPLYALAPTPPPALAAAPRPSDPCKPPAFNGTLRAQYDAYSRNVSVWYQSHSSQIQAALSQCPDLVSLAADGPVCTTTSTPTPKPVVATPTPTAKPPPPPPAATNNNNPPPPPRPRPTGARPTRPSTRPPPSPPTSRPRATRVALRASSAWR
ncbi:hypothetical protein PG999_014699 [Apiospora kogelbergensis]|uniref:Uncharacterized protein n=1 Tax=Apiospora kogelbergensis TaxID=1337665 RepID=A0AAW0Q2N2_9PEZI